MPPPTHAKEVYATGLCRLWWAAAVDFQVLFVTFISRYLNVHSTDRITNKELWKKTNEPLNVKEERGTGSVTHWDKVMTALPNKCYSGCHEATEEEDDRETLGKEIWRRKCGQQASGLAGGRWRRQHKTAPGGCEWSVACAALGATRRESTMSVCSVFACVVKKYPIQLVIWTHSPCVADAQTFFSVTEPLLLTESHLYQFTVNKNNHNILQCCWHTAGLLNCNCKNWLLVFSIFKQ